MFCTQCGTATAGDAKFCGNCGAPAQSASSPRVREPENTLPPPPISKAEPSVPQVRPWVRYWARMFDIYLAAIVGGVAIGFLNPDAFTEPGSDQLYGLAIVFSWVFIEALFLSTAGTTPGKWLFKTRIVAPHGNALDYSTALSRSFKVWWRGLGIGFPLASLITLIVAHGKLTKNGVTTWDRDDGFTITHERIGALRVIVAVVFFTGFLMLVVVGSAANA